MTFRLFIKWLLFPGVNLHSRLRFAEIPRHFGKPEAGARRTVLDAGCGNGMLSYRSYLLGNTVRGLSIKEPEVAGCRALFNAYLRLPEEKISFRKQNLYDARFEPCAFDEIICTEVLEHIVRHDAVCGKFWHALKPGGILHITAPNARHPYNQQFPLDAGENGGHVRTGYTPDSYHALLEPLGFSIEIIQPLGGPLRQFCNRHIKTAQEHFGPLAGVPLFLLSLPALLAEPWVPARGEPFAYYVKARKPARTEC